MRDLAGMDGTSHKVARSTNRVATAKKVIEADRDICSAKKLLTGTPATIPADTPTLILATAFGSSPGLASDAATEKAMAQYTGWNKAGSTLTARST